MDNLVIAIDGPSGAGKSTIAKLISKRLGITYIDTGAMYRAITYKVLENNINLNNIKDINEILNNTDIDFKNNHIYLDNKLIDDKIRKNIINKNVSNVSKIKEIRKKLVDLQRNIAKNKDVVMDGRDIGSHVLKNACFKFYINATPEERGNRRYKELKDLNISLDEVISDMKNRDLIDSTRKISPLIKTKDAIEIDTTNKTVEEVVNIIINHIEKNRAKK